MNNINKSWIALFHKTLSSFVDIPQNELDKGLERLKHLHLNKYDYFIKTGDIPDKMAFIAKGIFRVFYITEKGDEKILVFREEGRMLSAFSAFLENKESWFNIQALEESDLLYISFLDYKKHLNEDPCWQIINSKYVEMIFIEKEKRESEFLSDNPETRYIKFIQKYPGIEKRIRQYHIASYLGITPVALSRIRKRIQKQK
jgi:CRP-like cAMP-binding protein